MTKVCLLDKCYRAWGMSSEDALKNYLLFETEEEIVCGEQFVHKGKNYHVGCSRPKENIVFCEEFSYKGERDTVRESEITCPYCGDIYQDSWEMGESEDEEICSTCGSVFSWEKEIEVTYYSVPKRLHKLRIL